MTLRTLRNLVSRLKSLLSVHDRLESLYESQARLAARLSSVDRRLEFIQESLGRVEQRQLKNIPSFDLSENEYRVFSQWGEDGIIQFLLSHIKIDKRIFVEFGADDYEFESNTRFLLTNDNWAGLVIDSNSERINQLKISRAYWVHNLKAVSAFVTRDNINNLISENGITGEIGLLSIDIDGNDYWVWQAIDVIRPVIVIVEYNYRFGSKSAVAVPYDENFDRVKAHPSKLYFGASLKALCYLGNRKGYAFVGCNSNGMNAFFVRKDKKPPQIKELKPEEGYVFGQVGEMVEANGTFTKIYPEDEKLILEELGLPLVEVENSFVPSETEK